MSVAASAWLLSAEFCRRLERAACAWHPGACSAMALRTCWMPGFIASDPLAQALVRVSDDAIAQDNDALLRDYLAEDYVFHGPVGDLAGSTVHHSWTRRRAGEHQAARDE